jgi:predicted permease
VTGLFRALLLLLPASFRAEYGEAMAEVFARRVQSAGGSGERALLLASAAWDAVLTALRVHLDLLRQDLRGIARGVRHAPGFALTVVVVAGLGVGATTAAFSVTDHVLLRPLPFPAPEALVQLWQNQVPSGYSRVELSPANFRDWQRLSSSFTAMGAYNRNSVNLAGDGEPERLECARVSHELIPLLGSPPLVGRLFAPEDDRDGAPGTAILGYGLWRERFGADPSVVGRTILLDNEPHRVIGVMPRGFLFPRRETRIWLPLRLPAQAYENRDDLWLEAVGRLRAGVTLDAARAELRLVAAQLERQYPRENEGMSATVVELRDQLTRQSRLLLTALFGASLGVLLIACTNLASLFLARALERRRELAVRAALGAGRERLMRQLLTESLALSAGGGALGVGLAVAALPLVTRLVPNALPIETLPALDLRVLAFAALATLATAAGFGLAPALRRLGAGDATALREGARSAGGGRERLRSTLVVAELAVAVALLIASGLLIRALLRVQAVDPGFESASVLTLRTTLPMPRYQPLAARNGFHAGVLADVRALPGVKSAAYTSFLPMVMTGGIWTIEADGRAADEDARTASIRYVTPGYFETLGIPLRLGRDVSEADTAGSLQVAVVSESFAARYWPDANPIGRRFRFGLLGGATVGATVDFQNRTVVGVVGDVKVRGLERQSEPQVYLPYRQQPEDAMGFYTPQDLAVRHDGDAIALVPALRRIVGRADPSLPVADVRTLEAIVETQTAPRRTQVRVLAGFASLAVLLAGVGIHGLLAFTVASRAREIGVRRALGASARDVVRMVVGHGVGLAAAGLALGLALAWFAGRGLEALLAGVSPRDAWTFGGAALVALATAVLGSLLPALRAARVDPLTVMRAE